MSNGSNSSELESLEFLWRERLNFGTEAILGLSTKEFITCFDGIILFPFFKF